MVLETMGTIVGTASALVTLIAAAAALTRTQRLTKRVERNQALLKELEGDDHEQLAQEVHYEIRQMIALRRYPVAGPMEAVTILYYLAMPFLPLIGIWFDSIFNRSRDETYSFISSWAVTASVIVVALASGSVKNVAHRAGCRSAYIKNAEDARRVWQHPRVPRVHRYDSMTYFSTLYSLAVAMMNWSLAKEIPRDSLPINPGWIGVVSGFTVGFGLFFVMRDFNNKFKESRNALLSRKE